MRSVRGWLCAAALLLVLGWLVTFFVSPWSDQSNTDVTHFPPRAQEWIDGKLQSVYPSGWAQRAATTTRLPWVG